MKYSERTELLKMNEDQLARLCRIDTFKGSGRGGQKRNKTSTAIRIVHMDSNVTAYCDDSRSQHTNKHHAVQALRKNLALEVRCEDNPVTSLMPPPALKNEKYALWVADLLDILNSVGWRITDISETTNLSTNQLVKKLQRDSNLWQIINKERQKNSLSPLKGR